MRNTQRSLAAGIALILGLSAGLRADAQIVSPTGTYPPPPGVPLFDVSTEAGQHRYRLYMTKQYVSQELAPLYASHRGEPVWMEAWDYMERKLLAGELLGPLHIEHLEWLGKDNDLDGAPEPVFVRAHFREGYYAPAQFRAISEAY